MKTTHLKALAILTATLSVNAFAIELVNTNAISTEIYENRSEYQCSSHFVESSIYGEMSICVRANSDVFMNYVSNWKDKLDNEYKSSAQELLDNHYFSNRADSVMTLKGRDGTHTVIMNNSIVKTENDKSLFTAMKMYFSNKSLLNVMNSKTNIKIASTNN